MTIISYILWVIGLVLWTLWFIFNCKNILWLPSIIFIYMGNIIAKVEEYQQPKEEAKEMRKPKKAEDENS